jgi:hypothetical protein
LLHYVQEQRRRINAMLQDYELQRRLHAEQLQFGQAQTQARFICCNNAPDDVSAEALTENNRLPAMSDMAHQSAIVTRD